MYTARRSSGVCPGRENKINKVARRGPFPPIVHALAVLGALGTLALAAPAPAATLLGRVVGVSDGDTITVLGADRARERVRLAGIDAPESRQAFGAAARRGLAGLVFGAEVRVEYAKRDRYGR
ncbi:MAG: thermonuclease family protein, partial [Burkholderiales bacterium]|nr:thermonuclease family protein [Burkholderiales bacterium]